MTFCLWLLCGVIAAMIGARKNAGCLSFIVGLLFGPFGILFALLSKGDQKTCPFCRSYMHRDATVCRYCHRDQESDGAPAFGAGRRRSGDSDIVDGVVLDE